MPFKSEKQRRYLWTNHPEIAQRWANEEKKMPDHYEDKEKKRPDLSKLIKREKGKGSGSSFRRLKKRAGRYKRKNVHGEPVGTKLKKPKNVHGEPVGTKLKRKPTAKAQARSTRGSRASSLVRKKGRKMAMAAIKKWHSKRGNK